MPTPMTPPVHIAVATSGTTSEVVVDGELDLCAGRDLRDAAAALASCRPPIVEVDLAGVSFVDTAGWQALGSSLDLLAESGSVVSVVHRSPAVDRLVDALRRGDRPVT